MINHTSKGRVHALIVAAGRGSRFGHSQPKQYIKIEDQTLLEHSVNRLGAHPEITECTVVIAHDDKVAQDLRFTLPVRFCIGGGERWQSVHAGLKAIMDRGARLDDLILIHDAARPAVPIADINAVINAAWQQPYGAILAAPVTDTLKKSQSPTASKAISKRHNHSIALPKAANYSDHTVDRNHLWHAYTPQIFRAGALCEVLQYVATHQLAITDEASAFEQLSYPVCLVTGSRQNIKLTYPEDYALLSLILNMQQSMD